MNAQSSALYSFDNSKVSQLIFQTERKLVAAITTYERGDPVATYHMGRLIILEKSEENTLLTNEGKAKDFNM